MSFLGTGGRCSLTVWAMREERPEFGYGQGRRPLWSEPDRDAERVRDILRGAGLVEFGDTRPGFVVEGGRASTPFLVAYAGPGRDAAMEVAAYSRALTGAGLRVEPDADDDQTLRVWLPA
jgi:hypothetical protein